MSLSFLNDTAFLFLTIKHALSQMFIQRLMSFQSSSVKHQIVNDTHSEKLCFTQFSTIMSTWLLLTFSICLHNQLRSKNVFYHIDSKNE